MSRWNWAWFMERAKEGDGECVIWVSGVNTYGYPSARLEGKSGTSVRNYIYTKVLGKKLPAGYKVSSRCGNKLCISERCLVSRSSSEIVRRSYKSRRVSSGTITANLRDLGYVRLNLDIAREVRASNEPTAYWAEKLGVSQTTIRDIKTGKRWPETRHGSSVFTWAYAKKEAA